MTTSAFTVPLALRQKYMVILETRHGELARFLGECRARHGTPETYAAIKGCAHNLHGSGKTYGYPHISATAAALEHALSTPREPEALVVLTEALMKACEEAMQSAAEPEAGPKATLPRLTSVRQPGTDSKPLMLIADDDLAVIDVLQQLFARETDIIVATNGREALRLIKERGPVLVILDDRMPQMTGHKVLSALQADNVPLPVIVMLTANNHRDEILRGIQAGVVDYVIKPFAPNRLASRIRQLLRNLQTKILLADDDASVRHLLAHKLGKQGFQIFHAEDGEQALEIAQREKPDLVILDRLMPKMDGLAVLHAIRDDIQLDETLVILLTSKREGKDITDGIEKGAADYVAKPFVVDDVIARIITRLSSNQAP